MTNSEAPKKPRKLSGHILDLALSMGVPVEELVQRVEFDGVDIGYIPTEKELKYFERLRQTREPVKLTAKQLFDRVRSAGYVIDSENELIVKKLCLYFSGDPRMSDEKYGMNPNKGIALLGGLGVGKTWLMKLLRYNSHLPYIFVNCSEIADEVEQGGSENLATYFHLRKTTSSYLYYGNDTLGLCLNELGREQIPVKYFGNPTNVIERILFTRYEKEVPHNRTYFTTNKSVEQIEALYGDYIRDRMREMFNLIIFPQDAKSRRK